MLLNGTHFIAWSIPIQPREEKWHMKQNQKVEESSTNLKSTITKMIPAGERRSSPDCTDIIETDMIVKKLHTVTSGLQKYVYKQLTEQVSKENSITIADYILAQKTEVNLADTYRASIITTLITLSKFLNNMPFKNMAREDILSYLDNLRKPEASDPLHRWIGSYNEKRQRLAKFFKWLYSPDTEAGKRPKPAVLENIPTLRRKEQSIYKPTDIWNREEDLLFLRYCPNRRDRCYHAVSRDASGRPHEILGIKVRDIHFKATPDGKQYAEVIINGKTGTRAIPLIDSIPYLKDWLDNHPQPGNANALLIPSLNRATFGKKMGHNAIDAIYHRYKTQSFPKLLEDPNVSPEDKQKIKELLKKPWNPYIRRHSALTEKSVVLKEHTLRQHAGWSPRSQMHLKYVHYFGNESNDSILEAYGIIPKHKQLSDALRPKQCPNCNEPNKPDSKFCAKCRMVLTYDSYNETIEEKQEKDKELSLVKERMGKIEDILLAIQPFLRELKPEVLDKLEISESK
jgi:integrase/recombinase XerD